MAHPIAQPQSQVVPAPRAHATSKLSQRQQRLAWIMILPTLIALIAVALYPLLRTFYSSFTDTRLASNKPIHFIGLRNYRDLIQDTDFRRSIWVTARFAVITIAIESVIGMLIALVINSHFKGRGMVRAAMLVPWAIPTAVSTQMWRWMYNDVYGPFNDILVHRLHLLNQNVAFIAQSNTALGAVIAVDVWKTTPFVTLLLLAGLQVIPLDVYEAAKIDGAGPFRQFFSITLPLLRPAILVTLIFRTLDALRVFDVFYVMFAGRADTQTMSIYNQRTIVEFSDLGYGATISVAIFFIIGIFVVAYMTLFKVDRT